MEELYLTVADHVQRVVKNNFALAWQDMNPESEVEETYALSKHKNIKGKFTTYWEYFERCDINGFYTRVTYGTTSEKIQSSIFQTPYYIWKLKYGTYYSSN